MRISYIVFKADKKVVDCLLGFQGQKGIIFSPLANGCFEATHTFKLTNLEAIIDKIQASGLIVEEVADDIKERFLERTYGAH